MSESLLRGLHDNLWLSIRHTFNTDRVMLGVAYLVNFSAFVTLMSLLPEKVNSAILAVAGLTGINGLLFMSLRNSQREVVATLRSLAQLYEDNALGQYFGEAKARYYRERYALWLMLIPALMMLAVILALAFTYSD